MTETASFSRIEALSGRPVVQVGLIVRDLDRGMAAYSAVWGVAPWRVYTYGPSCSRARRFAGSRPSSRWRSGSPAVGHSSS